jgi:hypothetical protein
MVTISKSAKQLAKALTSNATFTFSFVKKNGDLRQATGTITDSLIPKELRGKKMQSTANAVTFFDLNKNEWRSVSATSPIYFG